MKFDPGPSPLLQLRRKLGLSIADLAQLSGLTESTILRVEQGKPVSARRVRRLYTRLVARLIAGAGPETQTQAQRRALLTQLLTEYFNWRERLWELLELEVEERLAQVRMRDSFR